jgi:hypothetical protein
MLGEKGPVEVGVAPSGPLKKPVAQSATRVAARVAAFLATDEIPQGVVDFVMTEDGEPVTLQPLNAGFFVLERMRQKRGPRVKGTQVTVRSGK